jgi:hypothetical protein
LVCVGAASPESAFVSVGWGHCEDAAAAGGCSFRGNGAGARGGGALARSVCAAGLFGSNRGGSVCLLT